MNSSISESRAPLQFRPEFVHITRNLNGTIREACSSHSNVCVIGTACHLASSSINSSNVTQPDQNFRGTLEQLWLKDVDFDLPPSGPTKITSSVSKLQIRCVSGCDWDAK